MQSYLKRKLRRYMQIIVILAFVIWNVVPTFFVADIEELKKSVVQLYVYDDFDEIVASGSGVVAFADDVVVTNAHVVDGNYRLEAISENNTKYQIEGIIGYNKTKDIAILKLSDRKNLNQACKMKILMEI